MYLENGIQKIKKDRIEPCKCSKSYRKSYPKF